MGLLDWVKEHISRCIKTLGDYKIIFIGTIVATLLSWFVFLFGVRENLHNQLPYIFPTIVVLSGVGVPIMLNALNIDEHDFESIIKKLKIFVFIAISTSILNISLFLSYSGIDAVIVHNVNESLQASNATSLEAGNIDVVLYMLFIWLFILLLFLFFDILYSISEIYSGSEIKRYAKKFKKYTEKRDHPKTKDLIQKINKKIKNEPLNLDDITDIIDGLLNIDGDNIDVLELVFPTSESGDSIIGNIYKKIEDRKTFVKSLLIQTHDLERMKLTDVPTMECYFESFRYLENNCEIVIDLLDQINNLPRKDLEPIYLQTIDYLLNRDDLMKLLTNDDHLLIFKKFFDSKKLPEKLSLYLKHDSRMITITS